MMSTGHMKVFVPTKITHAGRLYMSVVRNDRVRIVAFREMDHAQSAVAAIEVGDLIGVWNEALTYKVHADKSPGAMIVMETDVDAVLKVSDLGVDICYFDPPNFVSICDSLLPAARNPREILKGAYDISGDFLLD